MTPTTIITGASSGLGLTLTHHLLDNGHRIIATHHTTQPPLTHPNLTWLNADLTSEESTHHLACSIQEATANTHLHSLIHCAGVATLGHLADTSRTTLEHHMAINLHAPAQLTTELLPTLRHHHTHIIYINSGAGLHTNPNWGAYSASKHAARAWCDTLRQEEPDIRVTSIYPGRIDTPMQRSIINQEGGTYNPEDFLSPDDVAQAVLQCLKTPSTVSVPDLSIRPRAVQ